MRKVNQTHAPNVQKVKLSLLYKISSLIFGSNRDSVHNWNRIFFHKKRFFTKKKNLIFRGKKNLSFSDVTDTNALFCELESKCCKMQFDSEFMTSLKCLTTSRFENGKFWSLGLSMNDVTHFWTHRSPGLPS